LRDCCKGKVSQRRRLSRAYQPGHDIVVPLMGRDLCVEVKARADGFRELYGWLDERDVLIVKADRLEPLVVVRLSLAAEIAAEKRRASDDRGP
jgi:hypothetical protein